MVIRSESSEEEEKREKERKLWALKSKFKKEHLSDVVVDLNCVMVVIVNVSMEMEGWKYMEEDSKRVVFSMGKIVNQEYRLIYDHKMVVLVG